MAIIGISGKIGSGKDTVAKMIQFLTLNDKADKDWYYYNDFIKYHEDDVQSHLFDTKWEVKRFADKLKDTVCLWLGCTREQLEDREFKEKPLGEEWIRWEIYNSGHLYTLKATQSEATQYCNRKNQLTESKSFSCRPVKLTPRKLMQLLGTEAGRQIIHPNIWVNATFADYGLRPGYEHRDGVTFPEARTAKFPDWIIPDTRFPNEAEAIKDRGGVLIRVHRGIDKRFPKLWTEFGYDGNRAMLRNDFYNFVKKKDEELYQKLTHASETSLDSYSDWDYTITNDGTMQTLFEIVKNIYEEIDEKDNDRSRA